MLPVDTASSMQQSFWANVTGRGFFSHSDRIDGLDMNRVAIRPVVPGRLKTSSNWDCSVDGGSVSPAAQPILNVAHGRFPAS